MQSWELIRAFLALHRAGTFEGAAQMLAVDHSTLRRRIQTLEQSVGSALFCRLDGHYTVMPSMSPLLEAALRMEASSRSFFDGAGDSETGTVRVTMMDVFANWLAPDLVAFRKLYPDIKLDISTEAYFVDLEREMVDVAVRMARPTKGSGRLRKLAEVPFGVYASPEYLAARRELPADAPHELLTLSVHFMHRDHDFLAGESAWMMQLLPAGQVVCGTDSYLSLRQYCEAGMGLSLLPEHLGEESDHLVRVSQAPGATCDLWLVTHSNTGFSGCIRLFVDFLNETFRRRMGRYMECVA